MNTASIPTARSGSQITGLFNLRVAGVLGVATESDRAVTAPGVSVCRADAPHELTPAGAATLHELGVTQIIDLRAPYEFSRHPYDIDGMVRIAHPFELVRPGDRPEQLDLADLYQRLLAERGPQLVAVVRDVLAAPAGVLVHCTAGKDRTGIVIALLLLAVGAPVDRVVDDYALTEANLAGEWTDRYLQQAPAELQKLIDARVLSVLNASPAAVMRHTIEWIEQQWGGAAHYLRDHGLTAEELDQLRARFTAAPELLRASVPRN